MKWFIQGHAAWGMQEGNIHKLGGLFPLGLTLVLCGEFLASIVTLAVPCTEPPLTDKELLGLWVTVPR